MQEVTQAQRGFADQNNALALRTLADIHTQLGRHGALGPAWRCRLKVEYISSCDGVLLGRFKAAAEASCENLQTPV